MTKMTMSQPLWTLTLSHCELLVDICCGTVGSFAFQSNINNFYGSQGEMVPLERLSNSRMTHELGLTCDLGPSTDEFTSHRSQNDE